MSRRRVRGLPTDLAWIVAIGLLFLVTLIAHHRFRQTDFRSYYDAAGHLLAGRPLYFTPPFYFVYAPAVALLFIPFRALGLHPAMLAWYAVNVALVCLLWRLLVREMGPLRRGLSVVFFLASGFALERELHVGNVNLLNLVLCLAAVGLVQRARWMAGGLALALAVLIKPQNGLLLLPLARRQPRVVPVLAGALALQAFLPLPFYGAAGTVDVHRQYLKMILAFQQGSAVPGFFKFSATTAGLLHRLLDPLLPGDPRALLQAAGLLIAVGLIVFLTWRRTDPPGAEALALALVPLTAVSDYQFFLFAAPLIYLLLREWNRGSLSRGQRWCLVGSLLLYGGNWHDLWGDRLSRLFLDLGVQGLGTWCLIGVFLWVTMGRRISRPLVGVSACLLGQPVRYDGGHKRSRVVAGDLSRLFEWVAVCPEMEIGLGVPRETIRLEMAPEGPGVPGAGAESDPGGSGRGALAGGAARHPRLVSTRSCRDLTALMEEQARRRVEALAAAGIRGFIFKKGSPSCGPGGVPVFDAAGADAGAAGAPTLAGPAAGGPVGAGAGIFARILMERLPGLPVVDEDQIEDPGACREFIARVAAYQPL